MMGGKKPLLFAMTGWQQLSLNKFAISNKQNIKNNLGEKLINE
jgi:hypothetical protein